MPAEIEPGAYTDTGTGAYDNPPEEVTFESPADNEPTGAVDGPAEETTWESPPDHLADPTGAADNPPAETTRYEWPAQEPTKSSKKAVTADEGDVENKAVKSATTKVARKS